MFLRQVLHMWGVCFGGISAVSGNSPWVDVLSYIPSQLSRRHITDVWISPAVFWLVLCYTWLVCFCVIFCSYIILYNIEHTNILNAHGSISLQPSTKTCLLQLASLSVRLFLLSLCPPWFSSVDAGRAPGPHSALWRLSGCFLILLPLNEMDGPFLYLHTKSCSSSKTMLSAHILYFYFYPYVFAQNTKNEEQKPKSQILMFGSISSWTVQRRGRAASTFYL